MSDPIADIAIVGAGAAGLTAAIFAAQTAAGSRRVVVLDGAPRIGAKILIAGGGRCNVTHDIVTPEDFNGTRHIVRNVLAAFDADAAVRWFASLRVALKREDTGKLFPVSNRAQTVLDALLQRCQELGVTVLHSHHVGAIDARRPFTLHHSKGTLDADVVILATGGRSLPRSGSDGSGWALAKALGHSVTPTYPALVPLVLRSDFFHAALSGLSRDVELTTTAGGKRIDRRRGSLLFTHFGISGPVVLDASRHWVIANAEGRVPELRCNFFPDASFDDLEARLLDAARLQPRSTVRSLLRAELPERLVEQLTRVAAVDATQPLPQLRREQRRALAHALTSLLLPVEGSRGWDHAEVTAGGVPLSEIDYRTLQSKLVHGLFLIGEMLDCEGRIGGFNFQWAWATGHLAGRAAGAMQLT